MALENDAQQADTGGGWIPPYGTPVFDIGVVNLGPLLLIAIDRRIRPVEYSPALEARQRGGEHDEVHHAARRVDTDLERRSRTG